MYKQISCCVGNEKFICSGCVLLMLLLFSCVGKAQLLGICYVVLVYLPNSYRVVAMYLSGTCSLTSV